MIKKLFDITKSIYAILICTLILCNTSLYAAAPPMPGMPNMSDADMQKFMSELENTAKEIDNFVSSLPPAEQEEFNKAVQEVEQMINDMDPAELEEFIGGMFGAPGAAQPQPKKPAKPTVPVEEIKVEEKPKLSKKELSEQEKALDLINALTKRIESFMVKAQAMPELAGKTKRWAKKGRIRNWQADMDWGQVKTAIDRLAQKLHKMKDKDPKTKQYKFLKDFIEDKALYNNLALLRTNLDQYEPTLEVSAFGIKKLSKKDKSAVQQLIGSFTESLYVLKTPEALNKIIAKYEPRAKELMEEEKKIEERATQASKRGPRAKATTVGGTPEAEDYGDYGYGYDDYEDYGYPSYGAGYQQPSGYVGPSYQPSTSSSRPSTSQRRQSAQPKTRAGKTKKSKTPEATKIEKDKKEKPSKTKPYSPQLTKERMAAETYLDDITNLLSQALEEINKSSLLSGKTKQQLSKVESNDAIFDNVNIINSVTKKVKKINNDFVKRLRLKAKTPALRKAYKQRLENILKEIKIDKKTVKPKQELDALLKKLSDIETTKNNAPLINQYVYFGGMAGINKDKLESIAQVLNKEKEGEELTKEEQETTNKYKADFERMKESPQASLIELRQSINDLLDAVKEFDKEKKKTTKKAPAKK